MTEPGPRTTRRTETKADESDSEGLAHIVTKEEQMRGYIGGEAIRALCGKVWVPSRDYEGLPVCAVCLEERDRRLSGRRGLN